MGVTVNHWLGGFEPHIRSQIKKEAVCQTHLEPAMIQ
jgi:hypothetical protein